MFRIEMCCKYGHWVPWNYMFLGSVYHLVWSTIWGYLGIASLGSDVIMASVPCGMDFEKALDNMNREFLLDLLTSWIKGCLSSAEVSVIVNGSPTEQFQLQK
ncbi:hypothetical protein OSB04_030908 [Centaurea solstitialis]|uniref:Uncharacterized protein n=1 Tax=Centaurea solstitialis TaxID=347529 RepID=A0AA38W491_9ASTR|nr:hypothetical protein OSB04_030908 [Centaurea solstitialis]